MFCGIGLVGLVWFAFRRYLGALSEETGKHDADRLERWRERRHTRVSASELHQELPRAGPFAAPSTDLASSPLSARRDRQERLRGGALGTPGAARVVAIAVSSTSGRDAFLQSVRAVSEAKAFLFAGDTSTAPDRFQTFTGDLFAQLAEAVDVAARLVRQGDADGIAVFLDVPLAGSWQLEERLDLARFFAVLLRHEDCAVWISYEEPIDVSSWPSEVFLEAPVAPASLRQYLIECGVEELRDEVAFITVGNALRLTPAIAARSLLALVGEEAPATVGGATELPAYASYIVLAVGSDRVRNSAASVTRETTIAADLQAFMNEQSIRVVRVDGGGLLPLTPYRGRVTAWRKAASELGAAVDERALVSGDQAQTERARTELERLGEAIRESNQLLAAAVLIRSGRAWIETLDAPQYRDRLIETLDAFGLASAPGLWAHYLMALDSALRRNEPDVEWFSDDVCETAGRFGMEALFRAEQMEFARLRGDFLDAAAKASLLFPSLTGDIERSEPGDVYVDATARYVLANVLRRGGRYDIAQNLIETAHRAYDQSVPSHLVEWLHCRYGLSVCDAMAGVPRVEPDQGLEAGQLVFARSLVTLSNAQASWFVGDHVRAIEFASQAQDGFASIGYSRYAARAANVASVLAEWQRLSEHRPAVGVAASPIIGRIRDAISGASQPLDLTDLRPSAALTLLQFAMRFSPDVQAPREIVSPSVIWTDTSGALLLTEPIGSNSIAEADAALREAVGVGRSRLVPLLPD